MATPRRKSYPVSRKSGVSPLTLLKHELGRNASLLEEILLDKIILISNCLVYCSIDGYMRDGIKIGKVVEDSDSWELYILMTLKNRSASGLPEVDIFGVRPDPLSNVYERFSVEAFLEKAQVREEFQVVKGYDIRALAVLFKVRRTAF